MPITGRSQCPTLPIVWSWFETETGQHVCMVSHQTAPTPEQWELTVPRQQEKALPTRKNRTKAQIKTPYACLILTLES